MEKKNFLISVVTPNFNGEKYLRENYKIGIKSNK